MFIRNLEKGECPEHQKHQRCSTASYFECENCHKEFIVHGKTAISHTSYCGLDCRKVGIYAVMKKAEEDKKKWNRIRYGRKI